MKISIIDTLCPHNSLQDKLYFLEKLGIEGIELETALWGDVQKKKESVLEALSNSKVKLSTVLFGRQGDLQSNNRKTREITIKKIKQSLKACAELGGIGVVTLPSPFKGHKLFNLFSHRSKETKKTLASEEYKILGKYAEEVGVYVIIEPMDRSRTNFVNTCNEAVELCRMTGSDMVKICPDLFHMSIGEPNIDEKLKEFSDYIAHIHIGDNDFKSKSAKLPGNGNLDFNNILKTLKEINYSNYLSFDCEIPGEKELHTSIQFLKKLIGARR